MIQIKGELRRQLVECRSRTTPSQEIERSRTRFCTTHPDYVARARSLAPILAAAADDIERNRELPAPIVEALIQNGMFRLLQPRSFGGAELDPMTYIQVIEELARVDASTGWCVEQANGCAPLRRFSIPWRRTKSLAPMTGLLPGGRPGRPMLRSVPGGFRFTGAWPFASGSHHASWLGAHIFNRR